MSNYFRILNRLERRGGSPEEASHDAETAAGERGEARRRAWRPASGHQGVFAGLLDTFRALASGSSAPAVVLAGISREDGLGEVIGGLEVHAEARGVRICWAELAMVEGRRLLQWRSGRGGGPAELDVGATPPAEAVRAWFAEAGAGHDLVLVEAPPLDDSLDAALLACDAHGLVLVVEAGSTRRDALREGIERAKATGCRVLGLVMTGHRNWLPKWLSKLVSTYPRTVVKPRPAKKRPR